VPEGVTKIEGFSYETSNVADGSKAFEFDSECIEYGKKIGGAAVTFFPSKWKVWTHNCFVKPDNYEASKTAMTDAVSFLVVPQIQTINAMTNAMTMATSPPIKGPDKLKGVNYDTANLAEEKADTVSECIKYWGQYKEAPAVTFFPNLVGKNQMNCFVRQDLNGKTDDSDAETYVFKRPP
jgi:hypothetical protein